jgi:hypothetical protein
MMSGATPDHAAHVQEMQLIAALDGSRDIPNEAFQRATTTQHSEQQIAGINLRETTRGQLEHVVRRTVSERAHDYNVASSC